MATNLLGFRADLEWARRTAASLDTIQPLEEAGERLLGTVQRILSTSRGTGKPYRVRGQARVAAAAGQPPARQRGELAESFGMRVLPARRVRSRRRIRVGTREIEAPALEFGFRRSLDRGIAPHPFLRPALKAAIGQMNAAFRTRMRTRGVRSAKRRAWMRRGRELERLLREHGPR